MESYRVIIAGSRGFNDYKLLESEVDRILSQYKDKEIIILSGTAKGADQLGERYAKKHNLSIEKHPADWDSLGRKAGYLRNVEMACLSQELIAFWDGESRGTMHMINIAKDKGLKVNVINY